MKRKITVLTLCAMLLAFTVPAQAGLMAEARLSELLQETNEIIAMTVASIRTLQRRNGSSPFNRQSKIENQK